MQAKSTYVVEVNNFNQHLLAWINEFESTKRKSRNDQSYKHYKKSDLSL